MIGQLLRLSSLFTLVLTTEPSTPVQVDCLEAMNKCYETGDSGSEEIVTHGTRTVINIFHYCEDTRTRVIPCLARSLNVTLGPTAYDKGAFLYSCPYNKNAGSKQIMQDQGKGYLLNCVYNDIRNMQYEECLNEVTEKCGVKSNGPMSECAYMDPCPTGDDLYPFYRKRVIHASAQKTPDGSSKSVISPSTFKKGKTGHHLSPSQSSISISTTVSISLLSLYSLL